MKHNPDVVEIINCIGIFLISPYYQSNYVVRLIIPGLRPTLVAVQPSQIALQLI